MIKSLPGLENAQIMRYAYAIEYDCLNPTDLKLSMEFKKIDGLFSAGQIKRKFRGMRKLQPRDLWRGSMPYWKIRGVIP